MRTYFPAFLLAAGLLVTAPACAQTYRYGYPDYRADVQRRAYDRGYHEGTEDGRSDARKGRPADYRRHDEFRDADEGYNRSYGDREYYRDIFRRGYVAGYNDAYSANGGYYGGGYGGYYPPASTYPSYPPASNYPVYPGVQAPGGYYSSPAARAGYRDGLRVGREDARDRESYDPARSHYYREGDNDYDRDYGSRDQYKRDYRAAFQQGYRDGYGRGY